MCCKPRLLLRRMANRTGQRNLIYELKILLCVTCKINVFIVMVAGHGNGEM